MDKEGFTRKGFMLQAIAAGWHHKTAAQLAELGDRVGRERIQIVHGKLDRMITFPHAEVLWRELNGERGGVKQWWVVDAGHVIPIERREAFKEFVESMVEKAEAMRS